MFASFYCSFLLYVVTNLICIFLVSRQLVLFAAVPEFLNFFRGQKRVYRAVLLKNVHPTLCQSLFILPPKGPNFAYTRMGRTSALYTFILEKKCNRFDLRSYREIDVITSNACTVLPITHVQSKQQRSL